jgi:homoserine acetyltransferase
MPCAINESDQQVKKCWLAEYKEKLDKDLAKFCAGLQTQFDKAIARQTTMLQQEHEQANAQRQQQMEEQLRAQEEQLCARFQPQCVYSHIIM